MSELMLSYGEKDQAYFRGIRKDILPLLIPGAERVLEIGCGVGDTLGYLKETGRCAWAGGVELFPDAAASARERADAVFEGNIETMDLPIPEASIDVILCLDVLEHLVDPWSVVRKLDDLLRPGGAILASIPNVRNVGGVLPLVAMGRWRYTDAGLLDRTHLRFFTRASAVELMQCSGLQVDLVDSTWSVRGARLINAMTLSVFRSFLEQQYLVRARKVVQR